MQLPTETLTRPFGRIGATAQNALEVARFGALATDEAPSPYELAAEQRVYRRMLEAGFVIEDRLVTLADIQCPILSVVGTVDQIAPAPGVRAVRLAACEAFAS